MLQELIVFSIVLCAALYMIRSLRRDWLHYTRGCAGCALARLRAAGPAKTSRTRQSPPERL